MKIVGLISLLAPFLLALFLGDASSSGFSRAGTHPRPARAEEPSPGEEPERVQELLQRTWVQARRATPRKAQAAIIHEWLAPLAGVVISARVDAKGVERYRLTAALVKQTLERQLRESGIEVLDAHPPGNSPPVQHNPLTVATLCVEILGIVRSDGNVAAMCILLKLQQEVAQVAAATPNFARADTWQRATFALVTPRDIRMCCLDSLEELAGLFTRDWLDAHDDQSEEGPERL